ncbi:4-hydroxy-tetrahydrodipicolinate reductase [Myxococcota bacterium]|nr:4-hydroxy-tetrahydrodipicolinate reductase [Myxococcota bacterium]
MSTIDVVVSGAAGRLGRRIVALASEAPALRVRAGLVRPGSEHDGRDLGAVVGLGRVLGAIATSDAASVIVPGVVLVETALRKAAMEHVELAAERGVPTLVATTGFDGDERRRLEALSTKAPLLVAANLSLGVAVLLDLVERASKALPGYHLELVELHHAKKRDAPSGTAWALARAAEAGRGRDVERDAILARAGDVGPRGEHEVGIQSVRGGDIVGEHTVYLIAGTERVELTHRAASRDAFAAGAVRAAEFLGAPGRAPAFYTMRDVLGLDA